MNGPQSRVCLVAAMVLANASLVLVASAAGPTVRVDPMNSVGPRPVEEQTQSSILRDYLASWQALNNAMSENRSDLLDAYFVGQAKQQLTDTVREQTNIGIRTAYHDTSHHISVLFYSPEGLSIQLLDEVEYEITIRKGEQLVAARSVRTRYVAVLTPTESRWKVRLFQGGA